jgi:hypothetical protein
MKRNSATSTDADELKYLVVVLRVMESVEAFTVDWHAMCWKIEEQRFDRSECGRQSRMMTHRLVMWKLTGGGAGLSASAMMAFDSTFALALGIARANYKREGNWFTRMLQRIEAKFILNNNE